MLPAIGLLLFALITLDAVQKHHPNRFFYWSGIRLDSSPRQLREKRCEGDDMANCLDSGIVDLGLFTKALIILTIPAFVFGAGVVRGFGRFGVSETLIFFMAMPLLIGTWFYFLGWLIDRRKARSRTAA